MKKINSINYGGKVIAIGLINMLVIPGILLMLNTLFLSRYISLSIKLFFALGVGILIGFVLLLMVEFWQDKRINKYYSKHKQVKIILADGKCECGACGNRNVRVGSAFCSVCGCKYEVWMDRTPQEILKNNKLLNSSKSNDM